MTMAQRKLQQEIDRVFKRVAEGVQAFDGVYDKLMMTSNQAQKEKLEQDLKREIKKLQRLRDQIKTWMGSNDIKDKKALSDQRKLIETQMERFKACEKEMKTKAYSKEGLTASLRLDPREKEKQETGQFISSMIDDLDRQVETLEAEVESLQATAKRGKKDSSKAERIAEIERVIERHKWHQGKLEVILRLLENGNLEVDQVVNIQEDIKYYVESNQEVDFAEDDEIYDGLNLEEEEEIYGMNDINDHLSSQDTQSIQDEHEKEKEPTPTPKKPETVRKVSVKSPVVSHAAVMPAVLPTTTSTSMKPAPVPSRPAGEGLKYASAAAAAASSTPGLTPLPPPPSTLSAANKIIAEKSQAAAPTAGAVRGTASAASSPTISSDAVPVNVWQNGTAEETKLTETTTTSARIEVPDAKQDSRFQSPVPQKDVFGLKDIETELSKISNDIGPPSDETASEDSIFHLPSGLQDLISCFEAPKNRVESPPPLSSISKLLQTSLNYCPDSTDASKPRHYNPKTPYPTSPHFPQEPLSIFDDPLLFEKLDIDTLFYVFYYRQGTYQQYLAARELKRQSWRFHKKFLTWFQRHEEPKAITDDYEQGTYRYFDFEGTWLQRRKANFEFEYQYLEDEI
ncbi:Not1 N-terminal domain, CCR4-Not complex component-domain-containing protein [Lipomyces kononenkoae]|uniref:Not1 N-terminal domain, CCR4-Not complex component-domain-containing protein n=1 Tax=Lipomyces kononenkoae TaxID=34357 RepID=A0ACC3TBX2_LIPKO